MTIAAVILARGGSTRIPQKNLRPFRGRPLVGHAINAAQASNVFDRVVVSTDDEEIARVAREIGASVPFLRPSELADDWTSTDAAFANSVDHLGGLDESLATACCIYPSPFVSPVDLRAGLELLDTTHAPSVVPVVRYDFPIEQALRIVSGAIDPVDSKAMELRSQDLEPSFHDAGLFYWTRVAEFRRSGMLLGRDTRALEIPSWRCQDINTLEDWALAELKYDLILTNGTAQ